MASYLDDDFQSSESPAGSGVGDRGEGDWTSSTTDDRRAYCQRCHRGYWLEDGCESCRRNRQQGTEVRDTSESLSPSLVALNARGRSSAPDPAEAAGASSEICGMHPALAEHTLQRCIDAWGGLAGLLVAIQGWEET